MAKYTDADIKNLAQKMSIQREDENPFSFVTGAGCSISAGIPSAGTLVKRINEDEKLSLYVQNLSKKHRQDYGHCMANLAENKRKELLNSYLNNAKLNWGHIALASMMEAGYIRRVLTFNFDNILVRACGLCGLYPATYDYALSAPKTSSHIVEPAVIHLHGQGHGLVMLNTKEETDRHSQLVRPIIRDTLSSSEVIVIGYSGEADNAFEVIKEEFTGKEYLYWCSYQENPAKHVTELLKTNSVAEHYGEVDSDDFLVQLAQELGCFPPKIFSKPVDHLRAEIQDVIPFKLQDSGKRDVKQALEIKLNAFEKAEISNKNEIELQTLLLEGKTNELIKFAEQDKIELSDTIKEIYNQAYFTEAIKSDDFNEQCKLYEQAVVYDDLDVHSLNNWGNALSNLDQYDDAIKKYRLAVKHNPKESKVFNNWGLALANLGQHDDAIKKYRQAVKLDPEYARAFNNLGNALANLGQHDDAIEKFRQAVELDPDDAIAFSNWGRALANLGQHDEAIEKFRQAVKLDQDDAIALSNWGLALANLGQHEDAIEKYRQAVELDSEYAIAINNWGLALGNLGQHEDAIEKFRQVVELDPDDAIAFSSWGRALANLGQHDDAIEKFRQAVKLDQDDAIALSNWGLALANLGQHEDAIEKYRQAVKLDPEYAIAINNWGLALGNLGQHEDAIEKFRQAVKLDPEYASAFNNWGNAIANLGQHDDAIEKYRQAVKLDSEYAIAISNWGVSLAKLGQHDDAIEKYRQAVKLDPEYASAFSNWGSALVSLGEHKKAAEVLSRAMKPSWECAYNMACVKALTQQNKECEKYLNLSLEHGKLPSLDHIRNDEDLKSVRQEKWFKRFLVRVEKFDKKTGEPT